MEIKGVSNKTLPLNEIVKQNSVPNMNSNSARKSDKLEISDEGRKMQTKSIESKDIAVIQEKIRNNFYDSLKVLDKTADAILQELKSQKANF